MQSQKALLIAALKKLYRKRISVDSASTVTLKKDKKGGFILIEIEESMLTLLHIASGKKSYHFIDVIKVDLPEKSRLHQVQKTSSRPARP
jgi:hypothetical protein